MSQWETQKGKASGGQFNMLAQGNVVANTINEQKTWMHTRGKMCWTCQKQSVPQKGCIMNMKTGLMKYVCKPCVDARKAKAKNDTQIC